jgi:hypothetical protein
MQYKPLGLFVISSPYLETFFLQGSSSVLTVLSLAVTVRTVHYNVQTIPLSARTVY